MPGKPPAANYGCSDYREEMRLMGLKRKLEEDSLTEEERRKLTEEIEKLEASMGMD